MFRSWSSLFMYLRIYNAILTRLLFLLVKDGSSSILENLSVFVYITDGNSRFKLHDFDIYWSNVLTERFSIPYKIQTKEDTSF